MADEHRAVVCGDRVRGRAPRPQEGLAERLHAREGRAVGILAPGGERRAEALAGRVPVEALDRPVVDLDQPGLDPQRGTGRRGDRAAGLRGRGSAGSSRSHRRRRSRARRPRVAPARTRSPSAGCRPVRSRPSAPSGRSGRGGRHRGGLPGSPAEDYEERTAGSLDGGFIRPARDPSIMRRLRQLPPGGRGRDLGSGIR